MGDVGDGDGAVSLVGDKPPSVELSNGFSVEYGSGILMAGGLMTWAPETSFSGADIMGVIVVFEVGYMEDNSNGRGDVGMLLFSTVTFLFNTPEVVKLEGTKRSGFGMRSN